MTDLAGRQRGSLLAIDSVAQGEAEYERSAWSHGRRRRGTPRGPEVARGPRRPADEWRWLKYARGEVPTALYRRLSAGHLVDRGTGSTFEARRARGLIVLRYERGLLGETSPRSA